MLILWLNHTQDFRVSNDLPTFRDRFLQFHGWTVPHLIVSIFTSESMYHVEMLAIDLQFQVGGSCPQICSYALHNQMERQQKEQEQAGEMWDNQFGLVFTDALGKYLVRRTVVKHFKKISQRAGVSDDARFHDLRHSFAVSSLYAGDDIKTLQANLGHATAQFTLDVYGHVTQKMRQDSANRMQKFYEQLNSENGL